MKKKLCQKFNSSVTVIIALFGIAVALAVTSLNLVQLANATTTDMMTGTLGEEPLNTTSMSSSDNNNSDSVLGRLFLTGDINNQDGGNAEQSEIATAFLVDLNGVRPDDPRSSTGIAFFSTNATGQLAFLENLIAIYQVKASPAGTAIQMWEWKGADLPFENMLP